MNPPTERDRECAEAIRDVIYTEDTAALIAARVAEATEELRKDRDIWLHANTVNNQHVATISASLAAVEKERDSLREQLALALATTRDYFAAKASDADVAEILACLPAGARPVSRQSARYIHADRMLAERNKEKP